MTDSCSCIDRLNGLLAGYNAEIEQALMGPQMPMIRTASLKKGRKPPVLMATFCPFCGVKYSDEVTSPPLSAEER